MKGKQTAVKKSRKSWGGDLVLGPKPASAWFNDMLIACKRIPECLEGLNLAKFSTSRLHQDAVMRHIWQLGEAASRQPTKIRLRHPAVDWKALVRFKRMIGLRGNSTMTPKQIWDFAKNIPKLEKYLCRSWTRTQREAAEARADARDARMADKICADIDAGRVRTYSHEEMLKYLGLEPGNPQSRLNRRYGFVFWLEEGLWTARAPAVSGAYGVGATAVEAKDDLIQALEALSEYLKKSGENVKAAVCDLLVATWKTKKPRRRRS
jgi:uncharacterized protein with HEPN domain/predicted RNase H-like HicB family nuclease